MRNFELPGRSPVLSLNGMAATSHPLATLTVVNVPQDGGNAIDAAIAAVAVLCVVEPQSTGIGGDCFALLSLAGSDEVIAYTGSGRSPAAASVEWFQANGIEKIQQWSPHAVTVPGAVDAWARLVADYGTKDVGELLQPAIAFARNGYPIAARVVHDFAMNTDLLRRDPQAARSPQRRVRPGILSRVPSDFFTCPYA
ncbi:MAG: gamma-glutamyltransferase [Deltaproteobacteria bacterium]|nr:gamma-glutamyltransferase [Deltaproteobacteria bacterium]